MRINHRRSWSPGDRRRRKGTALVELAVVLPLLSFILVASTDFARLFHDYIVITDGARNGAVYASQNTSMQPNAYLSGISAAALADAGGLSPAPSVSTVTGNTGVGNDYVDVTVSYPFKTLSSYPGIPNLMALNRTVRMRVPPSSYRMR